MISTLGLKVELGMFLLSGGRVESEVKLHRP